jgi:hypothetical protein
MPQLIQHIDQIAREKQRAVLFLLFKKPDSDPGDDEDFDYQHCAVRKEVQAWLSANGMAFCNCAGFASEDCMMPYQGQLYIDVPFDENDPQYHKLVGYLENPDGSMKLPGVLFCYLPLEKALDNAHHDEPGFWEKWAENF